MARTTTPGIDTRHAVSCPAVRDHNARCRCTPRYQAHVWSARDKARIRKTFRTLAAAKAWRAETVVALRRGTMRAPTATTLREAWDAWLAGATVFDRGSTILRIPRWRVQDIDTEADWKRAELMARALGLAGGAATSI